MEIHVWGAEKDIAIFHAESLAIAWYQVVFYAHRSDLSIVTSSNTFISPSGSLPFLKDGETYVNGFENIVQYLQKKIPSKVTAAANYESELVESGLMQYIENKLSVITKYTYLVNRENYERFTRSKFKDYLPFPMQYAPPLDLRKEAVEAANSVGLTEGTRQASDDDEEIKALKDQLKAIPTLSNVYKTQIDQKVSEILTKKGAVANMQCIYLAETYLSQITKVIDLESDKAPTASEILFMAHIFSQTYSELPDCFMRTYISDSHPELFAKVQLLAKSMEFKIKRSDLVRSPRSSEYPGLVNAILNYGNTLI
ncbi:unnamed protein product [Kuraishia capsulata CBS 1993]|uniref:Mitochondrial outer membrane transport complex Sam37/metaxin N-terminal domain-containing protein n=1 Tax=Kuraishia capsulata CBS 1993 TaxID=1382522 RepID=W6MFL6_9ASCO|nr:uncharacterized protein KUCA_T00000363001 [Kuraishia capsulata CBS 1993]CDK24401.1 unnamed protein product [Kuraishia capsulata CBS 1993]